MPVDPRVCELLSYYRDAELHGAALLLRLIRLMADDPEAQLRLTEQVADEARHAWLWTKHIAELGGAPVPIACGYQARIGKRILPRTLADLLALTVVVEARSLARYREHAARPEVAAGTRRVLDAVCADEAWHQSWLEAKLESLAAADAGVRQRIAAIEERYRTIEGEVFADLVAAERAAFGAAGEDVAAPRGGM